MNIDVRSVQNFFTYGMLMIIRVVKETRGTKFYAILLVSVMLTGVFSLSPAISSLTRNVVIKTTGRIATGTIAPVSHENEIRGVLLKDFWTYPYDLNVVAQTLSDYGINLVVIDLASPFDFLGDLLGETVDAMHAKGIKVHVLMPSVYWSFGHAATSAVDSSGAVSDWNCPTKLISSGIELQTVEQIVSNYDIDGWQFDYIRYVYSDICYCDEDKAKFEAWLGETITNWPGDFAPSGSRYNEFMEWRVEPITDLIREVRSLVLSYKPDAEFSADVFATGLPTGSRYWRGQDTAKWVAEGLIDFVSPMLYVSPDEFPSYAEKTRDYFVGGPEGKIPLVFYITTGLPSGPQTIEYFQQIVEYSRTYGDGFIIWRYGGPGITAPDHYDIRPYLDAIDLYPRFALQNITVDQITGMSARVNWATALGATSRVEYSTSPLFNASYRYSAAAGFHYWDVDHVVGTIIEDNTLVTEHSITLTDLLPGTKYYFRVQGEGSGIATSKVLTFTTKS